MFNNLNCILRDKLNISKNTEQLSIKATYPELPIKSILVLEYGRNPSTDYYINSRLPSTEKTPSQIIDISKTSAQTISIKEGTYVIIVRYLNKDWCNHLSNSNNKISGIALFMDDDLPEVIHDKTLPCKYRAKLKKRFYCHIKCISNLSSDLWVSCKALKEKYDHLDPTLLEPIPLFEEYPSHDLVADRNLPAIKSSLQQNNTNITYFYHGGLPHLNEAKWLKPIVEEVQLRNKNLRFMIIGDHKVRSLYRNTPRVKVLDRLDWITYRNYLPLYEHTIGLAPLLNSNHNNYRSHTKFLDFTRLGAVGIYSDTVPYKGFIKNAKDGFLLANDYKIWIDTILELAKSQEKRKLTLANAKYRVKDMLRNDHSLPILFETD